MRVVLLVIFVVFPLCTVVAPDKDAWPVTNFTETIGHYPSSYCHFSDVVFSPAEKAFLYRSDVGHHVDCHGIVDIWPIRNVSDISLNCDEEYDNGHVFTIYYWYGGSNYFHLHYDMLIPLYSAVHHNQEPDGYQNKHVFMPTVESRRLSILDWNTKAFTDYAKYWVQISKAISLPYTFTPLDQSLLDARKNICFKQIHFGTPSVQFSNSELINGLIEHIQKTVNVAHQPFEVDRIGLISRSNRRRILNENELIAALNTIAITERLDFSGKSFREQVALMQRYSVLVGVNGAGLMNGLYLPPYAVVVQMVPYKAVVNFREFGLLLKARGPYMEWHNTHENLTRTSPGDKYNNNADTIVDVEEFKKVAYEAVQLANKTRRSREQVHQEL